MLALRLLPLLSIVAGTTWPNLRVTFGLSPFGHFFYPYPLHDYEAIKDGWEKISSCGDDTPWFGNRYADPSDPSLILMYDVNGYIAGSQNGLMKSDVDLNIFNFETSPNYQVGEINGETAYFTTAYFVNPDSICEGGRSEAQFISQGVGYRLLFQTANGFMAPPLSQDAADETSEWFDHKCFIGMGDHYIGYNYQASQDCSEVFPAQLLFDDGKLSGFVWQHLADLPGDKWEHPTAQAISAIIDRHPDCLDDILKYPGLSTMHHYFHDNPWFTLCPLGEDMSQLPEFKDAMKNM